MRARLAPLALAAAALLGACDEDPVRPPGSLRIDIRMTGVDPDPSVEVRAGRTIFSAASTPAGFVVNNLRPGNHDVIVDGVASNCTVVGGATRTVTVTAGETAIVDIEVACVAVTGVLGIAILTFGEPVDPSSFRVAVGAGAPQPLVPRSPMRYIPNLPPGDVSVTLSGVPSMCTVALGNPRVVRVVTGGSRRDTVSAVFEVTCVKPRGDVHVTVRTTGVDIDPNGYSVTVGAQPMRPVAVTGTATLSLENATYAIGLGDVAGNCTVAGDNPRLVAVPPAGTVAVEFQVTCSTISRIALDIRTTGVDVDADGYTVTLTSPGMQLLDRAAANETIDFGPITAGTWTVSISDVAANCEVIGERSRTVVTTAGTSTLSIVVACTTLPRIAWAERTDVDWDIHTARADGSDVRRLRNNGTDELGPAWSRTGRIAFTSLRDDNFDIYAMNEDGTATARLTTHAALDESPAWSPDGSRIAFVSHRDGNRDIYVMDANGGNLARITSTTDADFDPAWSPDGTKIAFARGTCVVTGPCTADIHVMNADGSNVVKLTTDGFSGEPAWSPDGAKIAFSRNSACDAERSVCDRDIYMMSSSGTNVTFVHDTEQLDDSQPAWSPNGSRILVSALGFDMVLGFVMRAVIVRADGTDPIAVIHTGVSGMGAVWRP